VGAAHKIWKLVYSAFVAAVQEERCSGAVLSEGVEDLGCVDVWAVVEG
jgi:hypothetical protein